MLISIFSFPKVTVAEEISCYISGYVIDAY